MDGIGHYVGEVVEFGVNFACNKLINQDELCHILGRSVHEGLVEPIVDNSVYYFIKGEATTESLFKINIPELIASNIGAFGANYIVRYYALDHFVPGGDAWQLAAKVLVGMAGGYVGSSLYHYVADKVDQALSGVIAEIYSNDTHI
jgi:hypothetical protein